MVGCTPPTRGLLPIHPPYTLDPTTKGRAPFVLRDGDGGLHVADGGVAQVVQWVALQAVALQVLHAVLELPPRQRVRLHRLPALKYLQRTCVQGAVGAESGLMKVHCPATAGCHVPGLQTQQCWVADTHLQILGLLRLANNVGRSSPDSVPHNLGSSLPFQGLIVERHEPHAHLEVCALEAVVAPPAVDHHVHVEL